jgi:hypothetical protein
VPGQHDTARAGIARFLERDIEPVRRQPASGAFRPLDEERANGQRVVEAKLLELIVLEPVEITVAQREPRCFVLLHDREGGARHFRIAVEMGDQSSRQGRLTGAQRPAQSEDIACFKRKRDPAGETIEPGEIDAVEPPASAHPARLAR